MTGNFIFGSIMCHYFILKENCMVSKETYYVTLQEIFTLLLKSKNCLLEIMSLICGNNEKCLSNVSEFAAEFMMSS